MSVSTEARVFVSLFSDGKIPLRRALPTFAQYTPSSPGRLLVREKLSPSKSSGTDQCTGRCSMELNSII